MQPGQGARTGGPVGLLIVLARTVCGHLCDAGALVNKRFEVSLGQKVRLLFDSKVLFVEFKF